MTKMVVMASAFAALIAAICPADTTWAGDRSVCLEALSATEDPIFSGLREVKVDASDGSSTEGGEYRLYSNPRGILVYVVATQYGETGRKVFLYSFLDGSVHSYSVTVSSYRYVEPIYAGAVKAADVVTSSFVICDDIVVKGVGSEKVSQDITRSARSILSRAVDAYNAIKPNEGTSP